MSATVAGPAAAWEVPPAPSETPVDAYEVHNLARDGAGNTYVTGYVQGAGVLGSGPNAVSYSVSHRELFVLALDATNGTRWAIVASSTTFSNGRAIEVHPTTGDVLIAGVFDHAMQIADATLGAPASGSHAFVARFSGTGDVLDHHTMDGNIDLPTMAASASDVFVAGVVSGSADFGDGHATTATGTHPLLLHLTNALGVTWFRTDAELGPGLTHLGFEDLALYPDGDVAVIGEYRGTLHLGTNTFTSSNKNVWLARMNPDASVQWARQGGAFGQDDEANAVVVRPDGSADAFVSVRVNSSFGGQSIFRHDYDSWTAGVVRYGQHGSALFARRITGTDQGDRRSAATLVDGSAVAIAIAAASNIGPLGVVGMSDPPPWYGSGTGAIVVLEPDATVRWGLLTGITAAVEDNVAGAGTFTVAVEGSGSIGPGTGTSGAPMLTLAGTRSHLLHFPVSGQPRVDVAVTVTAPPAARAGERVTAQVTVTNQSTSATAPAVVVAPTPSTDGYFQVTEGTASQGTFSPPGWHVGALVPGASASLTLEAIVKSGNDCDHVKVEMQATSAGFELDVNDNLAATTMQINLSVQQGGEELAWVDAVHSTGDDIAAGLAVAPDGDLLVAGATDAGGDDHAVFAEGTAQETVVPTDDDQLFLARYEQDGALIWTRRFGGTVPGGGPLPTLPRVAVAATADGAAVVGGVAATGATFDGASSVPSSVTGGFVAKYAANGSLVWVTPVGGDVHSVDVAPDGSIWAGGQRGPWNAREGFIIHLDATGSAAWTAPAGHEVLNVTAQADGNASFGSILRNTMAYGSGATATTLTANGPADAVIGRTTAAGAFSDLRKINESDEAETLATHLVGPAGETYVVGSDGDGFVERVEANGTVTWKRWIPPPSRADLALGDGVLAVAATPEASIFVPLPSSEPFLLLDAATGATRQAAVGPVSPEGIEFAPGGRVYSSGAFQQRRSSIGDGSGGSWSLCNDSGTFATAIAEEQQVRDAYVAAFTPAAELHGSLYWLNVGSADGVRVTVYRDWPSWEVVASTMTNASGQWRIDGIEPGTYRISFRDPSGRMQDAWYHAGPGNARTYASASPVVVDELEHQFIGATMWPAPNTNLSGRVTDAVDSTGIAGASVFISEGGQHVIGLKTGADGSWSTADLPPGTYKLQVVPPDTSYKSRWYKNHVWGFFATSIVVAAATPATADQALPRNP